MVVFASCGNNERMKKYDFERDELWFSRRALQELACAERRNFGLYIKGVKRGSESWVQDEAYLLRLEGARRIRRKCVVYDLDTSYMIMRGYKREVPPDYGKIIGRLEELRKMAREDELVNLQGQGDLMRVLGDSVAEDKKLLDFLKEQNGYIKTLKRRIILDYASDGFNLIRESGEQHDQNNWPRTLFCCGFD